MKTKPTPTWIEHLSVTLSSSSGHSRKTHEIISHRTEPLRVSLEHVRLGVNGIARFKRLFHDSQGQVATMLTDVDVAVFDT